MATIGQALTAPESGWTRYDDTDVNITYPIGVSTTSVGTAYNGSITLLNGIDNSFFKFNFIGTKLRIISRGYSTYANSLDVYIDGVKVGNYSQATTSTNTTQYLVYEIENLALKEHSVEVIIKSNGGAHLDAVDIDDIGELKPYNEIIYVTKMSIKNPTTQQCYSLDNKTLIHLPDSSNKNMILHGIEAGKEIRLDEPFDKVNYISELSNIEQGTSGKVITQSLIKPINKIIKISEVKS